MPVSRRTVLDRLLKGSALTLSFSLGGASLLLTPGEARARSLPLTNLDEKQAATLEQLGEAILPGARAKGLVHFVDHQLGVAPDDCLLIAKYFQVEPPYRAFYAAGLAAAEKLAGQIAGKPLRELDTEEMRQLVTAMSKEGAADGGFSLFLFYLCLRSDAVDVVYGTPEGFRELNVPYLEHILPPEGWNG